MKVLYENGWFSGKIKYFNEKIRRYSVFYKDESVDLMDISDIDGVQIVLTLKEYKGLFYLLRVPCLIFSSSVFLNKFMKSCHVLSMFLTFWHLKPYVLLWSVHIQKTCICPSLLPGGARIPNLCLEWVRYIE